MITGCDITHVPVVLQHSQVDMRDDKHVHLAANHALNSAAAAAVALQVTAEFPGLLTTGSDLQHLLTSCPSSLMYSWASPELVRQIFNSWTRTIHSPRVFLLFPGLP
jgi:hypothetical protein